MTLAKTEAAGSTGLLPQVLQFSTSLHFDRQLFREDVLGSLAHVTMLGKTRILGDEDVSAIRKGLLHIFEQVQAGQMTLPEEEDVHMAVESALTQLIGDTAGRLHTARSRNDQVALDLRLHVRESCRSILLSLSTLIHALADRAEKERDVVLPSYTHRQRAIPVSLAYWFSNYAQMFARDAEAFAFAMKQADVFPLGVGAVAGTSLPIDRRISMKLLGFSAMTENGMDTVGDRDFAMDYAYAASRFLLHASRLATDLIDFSSAEFGFAKLDGDIACGSSMMPQKRNPDVFELIRGKTGRAVGNLTSLLVMIKGLPGGYNRDLQEDRQPILETKPLVQSVLDMLALALPKVTFDATRCREAVENDAMQATDLAEALVKKGLPFRTAYKAVGALVRKCQDEKVPLRHATLTMANSVSEHFDEKVLEAANPLGSVARKVSAGGTGADAISAQLISLRSKAAEVSKSTESIPSLETLWKQL